MQVTVRGNEIVCSGTFTAQDGSDAEPTNAAFIVVYTNNSGVETSQSIPMTQDVDGVWSAIWDSTSCRSGKVSWKAQCWGGIKGAKQGTFTVMANDANVLALDP
jgi:hypothetical protein